MGEMALITNKWENKMAGIGYTQVKSNGEIVAQILNLNNVLF